jgi:quercetin dioxygenase-like cupin family protein
MSSQAIVIEAGRIEIESGDDRGVTWRTLTSADRTPTQGLTSGVCELEPGAELALHRHPPPELYYFLEGTGVVTLGRDDHRVRPGSTIYIPGGTPHRIHNDGSTPLQLFYVFPVDSFSEVEYSMLDQGTR